MQDHSIREGERVGSARDLSSMIGRPEQKIDTCSSLQFQAMEEYKV